MELLENAAPAGALGAAAQVARAPRLPLSLCAAWAPTSISPGASSPRIARPAACSGLGLRRCLLLPSRFATHFSPPGAGALAPSAFPRLFSGFHFSLLSQSQWEGAGETSGASEAVPGLPRPALLTPSRHRHMERHEPGGRTGPAQDRESGGRKGLRFRSSAPTPTLLDELLSPGGSEGVGESAV